MTQYDNKKLMAIVNLVETTCLARYPWPIEISNDQGSELIGRDFKNTVVENMMVSKKIWCRLGTHS